MQYVLFDNYQASLAGEYFWLKMRALCLQKKWSYCSALGCCCSGR